MDLHEKKKTFENLRSTMEITTGSCKIVNTIIIVIIVIIVMLNIEIDLV